jgi:predicted nucleotidyltransferase component of viral defense system
MLHLETVDPFTLGLLKSLMSKEYLRQFVLVGGTALALQMGHRKSVDLDMFTVSDMDADSLLDCLQKDFEVLPKVKTKGSLICDVEKIKVDFIKFKYAFAYPVQEIDGIRLLSVEDIAPMKLDAITGRGSKKDFYDLYFLLERYNLQELLDLYIRKYQHSTLFHVIKSLTWFDDAEPQVLPDVLLKKVTWTQVKKRIEQAVTKL